MSDVTSRDRQRLAAVAARLMAEQGLDDFGAAKRKAARRLGLDEAMVEWPRNEEVEAAWHEHQRLFAPDQARALRRLREAALEAMDFFAGFSPRLVGAVLAGTADAHATLHLHLFADAPEEVIQLLLEYAIPYDEGDTRLTLADGSECDYPVFGFVAGEVPVAVTVLPTRALRVPPVRADGTPMPRAKSRAVARLIAGEG